MLRQLLPKAHFATVYAKPKGRPVVDTFITEVSQDTWIFFLGTWNRARPGRLLIHSPKPKTPRWQLLSESTKVDGQNS